MKIETRHFLSPEDIDLLQVFTRQCQEKDPSSPAPLCLGEEEGVLTWLLFQEERLIALLCALETEEKQLELSALTHPDFRGYGAFSRLQEALWQELSPSDYEEIFFFCRESCPSTVGFRDALGCEVVSTELLLRLDLSKGLPSSTTVEPYRQPVLFAQPSRNLSLLSRVHAPIFGQPIRESSEFFRVLLSEPGIQAYLLYAAQTAPVKGSAPSSPSKTHKKNSPIGCFLLHTTSHSACLFGFGLGKAIRGQGLGRAALGAVLSLLPGDCSLLTVQVSGDNAPALALYRSFGFAEQEVLSLCRFPVL